MVARPRRARRALPALLLPVALLSACDACDEQEPVAPVVDRTPVPPPETLQWEMTLGGGDATFAAAQELLPRELAAVLPGTPGELVERFVPSLALEARIPRDADLHVAGIATDGSWIVFATRVDLLPGEHPLGAGLPLFDGGPHGSRWVGEPPADEESHAAALVDDVLLVAERPAALEIALRYLAFTVAPGEHQPGMHLRFAPDFAPGLRSPFDDAIREQATGARAAAAAERSRHEEAPSFGEPEAVIGLVEEVLRDWTAYLPDLAELRIDLRIAGGSFRLEMEADVREGSPLAQDLAAAEGGASWGLSALPEGTALAWSTRATPGREEATRNRPVVDAIARAAGDRLDQSGQAVLEDVADAFAASRGSGLLVAVGSSGHTPWLSVATAPTREGPAPDLRAAAATSYLRDLGGALLGCQEGTSPAPWTRWIDAEPVAGVAIRGRSTRLCGAGEGELPALLVETEAGAVRAWTLLRAAEPTGGRDAAGGLAQRLSAGENGALGRHPDLRRALGGAEDRGLFAAVAVPSRILPAAGLVSIGPLRDAAARAPDGGPSDPIVLRLDRTERGLRAVIDLNAHALADAATLTRPFL